MSVSLLLYCFSFVKGVQTLRLPLGIDQISNLISGEKSIFLYKVSQINILFLCQAELIIIMLMLQWFEVSYLKKIKPPPIRAIGDNFLPTKCYERTGMKIIES